MDDGESPESRAESLVTDDRTMYDELIAPLEARMMRSIWRIVRNADLAEDTLQDVLAAFYGVLLAVICFVPYWKLTAELQNRAPVPRLEVRRRPRVCFVFSVLVSTILKPSLPEVWGTLQWVVYWPSLLLVLGGTLALMLFVGGSYSGPTPSTAFAVAGLIGSLMGFIQALFGFAGVSIAEIAAAVTFVLTSCFAALLGMLLVGAPLEDRAIRAGRATAPSVFSRVSWYVFPMPALIFLVLMFFMVVTPVTKPL
jgi:hypothetical protein